jgi:hypothetical protein
MSLMCVYFSVPRQLIPRPWIKVDIKREREKVRDRKNQKEKALLPICRGKNTKNSRQQWAGDGGQFRK